MVLYSKNIPIPENIPQSEIYESNTWWKAKKWSVFICYEIISQRPDTVEEGEFMKAFQNQLAVPILGPCPRRPSDAETNPRRAGTLEEKLQSARPAALFGGAMAGIRTWSGQNELLKYLLCCNDH